MVKKTVTYTDFNDVERTEDFYFHLTLSELMDMEAKDPEGSFAKRIEGIINNRDIFGILDAIKWVVEKAYGVRSADGRGFKKDPELTKEFVQSAAYEQMYMDLLDDPDEAANFINAMVPKKIPKAFMVENEVKTGKDELKVIE